MTWYTHPLFVYKPLKNTSGTEWILAVETLVEVLQGRHQGAQSDLQGDPPVFGHNLFFGHHVGPKRKFPVELAEVNTTQKKTNTASALGCITARGAGKRRDAVSTKRKWRRQRCRKAARCHQHLCPPFPQACNAERVSSEAAFSEDAKKRFAEDDRNLPS